MPRLPAALLLGAALVLAACGGDGGGSEVASSADSEPLRFVAPDVRGGQVEGADFAGQDLVIWFWAPW